MRIPHLRATSGELLTLDFLRFYASAAIVVQHSHEFLWPMNVRGEIIEKTHGLALFVDLFFLISGFVIGHLYSGKVGTPKHFGRFMQRRIGRLYPLHLLTFVLAIAMWALVSSFAKPEHVPSRDPACMALTAAMLHAVFPCGNGNYFNGVNWSISAEMVMYAIFPLLSAFALGARRLFLALSLALFAAILASVGTLDDWTQLYAPLRALPAFGLGLALNANRDLLLRVRFANLVMWLSLLGATACALVGAPVVIQLPLFYLAGFAATAIDVQGIANPVVTRIAPLGQLTYSIYLWHGFFIAVLVNAIGDKLLGGKLFAVAPLLAVCYAAILVWSYLSWRYFETPARRWIDGLFGGRGI
ncbi:MAG: acyltransferase [Sphingomonadales bacterium]|nr:acyltransferase [Sphingomonadales bacterium]